MNKLMGTFEVGIHIEDLPIEVLHEILNYIDVRDVVKCRLVSKRWRDIIDMIKDSTWKVYCTEAFHNAQEEFNKTDLTWRQLYRSLTLWSRVEDAGVTAYQLCKKETKHHFVVQNNLIGVLRPDPSKNYYDTLKLANSIAYYDVNTLKEHHKEVFDMPFVACKEDDHFYVLFSTTSLNYEDDRTPLNVLVLPKINKKLFSVGSICDHHEVNQVTICNDRVIFQNEHGFIVTAVLVGEEVITDTLINPFNERVTTFSYYNGQLCILSFSRKVYVVVNDGYEKQEEIEGSIVESFKSWCEYGFKWEYESRNMPMYIHRLGCNIFGNYNTTSGRTFISSRRKVLSFYYNLYDSVGRLNLHYREDEEKITDKPLRNVYLDAINRKLFHDQLVTQIHAICTENGKRLFLLMHSGIYVLDLHHKLQEKCIFTCASGKNDQIIVSHHNTGQNIQVSMFNNNIDNLPDGIMQNILKHLHSRDIVKNRLVSKKWRDNIDSINDSYWKRICETEFSNARREFNKTVLNWRQLYRSLSLWSKVKDATVTRYELCKTECSNFVIRNGSIGIPILDLTKKCDDTFYKELKGACNVIVYYNIETLTEHHREEFKQYFYSWKETEDFYVIVRSKYYVIPKVNNKYICLGYATMDSLPTLIGNKICYLNDERCIIVARVSNGELVTELKVNPQLEMFESVITVSQCNQSMYMLTWEGRIFDITSPELKALDLCRFYYNNVINTIDELQSYGFHWSSRGISIWLSVYSQIWPFVSGYPSTSGKMVVSGDRHDSTVLNFHYNPYNKRGTLTMYADNDMDEMLPAPAPDRTVNLESFQKLDPESKLEQLEVVCTERGQKVFVLTSESVLVVDLCYGLNGAGVASIKNHLKMKLQS